MLEGLTVGDQSLLTIDGLNLESSTEGFLVGLNGIFGHFMEVRWIFCFCYFLFVLSRRFILHYITLGIYVAFPASWNTKIEIAVRINDGVQYWNKRYIMTVLHKKT